MPSQAQSPSVAREGDILDQAIDRADLRVSQIDTVYKTWGSQGIVPALRLVATFKDGQTPAIRFKDAAGAALELPADVVQALTQRAQQAGIDPIALLRSMLGLAAPSNAPSGGGLGSLSDSEKAPAHTSKAAPPSRAIFGKS